MVAQKVKNLPAMQKTQLCVCVCVCVCARTRACVLVTQSCLILCNPINCSPPGSSVHGILQARILEWVAIPSSSMCIHIHVCVCVYNIHNNEWIRKNLLLHRVIKIWLITPTLKTKRQGDSIFRILGESIESLKCVSRLTFKSECHRKTVSDSSYHISEVISHI